MTAQLRSIYARWERLEEEKRATAEDLKELFAEAKSNGYDTKALRAAFRLRSLSEEKTAEQSEHETLVELYLAGLAGTNDAPRAHPRIARESLADSEPPPSPAVAPPAMTASADQESAVPSPIVASSTPSDDDATAPRAGQSREQSPARGEIDIDLPSFLDRKSPDCIANRAQGRG